MDDQLRNRINRINEILSDIEQVYKETEGADDYVYSLLRDSYQCLKRARVCEEHRITNLQEIRQCLDKHYGQN